MCLLPREVISTSLKKHGDQERTQAFANTSLLHRYLCTLAHITTTDSPVIFPEHDRQRLQGTHFGNSRYSPGSSYRPQLRDPRGRVWQSGRGYSE